MTDREQESMRELQHPTWRYLTMQEQLEAIVKKQDDRIDRILGDVPDDDVKEVQSCQTLQD